MSDERAPLAELQQRVWDHTNKRVSLDIPREQIKRIIQYKDNVPESRVNTLRDELILFIEENRNRLSLSCNGDCYQHHDGVVLSCHAQFIEDSYAIEKEAKINKEDARTP